jgi:hypothetical protein
MIPNMPLNMNNAIPDTPGAPIATRSITVAKTNPVFRASA